CGTCKALKTFWPAPCKPSGFFLLRLGKLRNRLSNFSGRHMPLLKTAKRYGILCRVSTRDQLRGLSLEVQEKLGREYVKMRGGTVAKVWSAQESGTSENRAVLDEVLSKAGVLYDHL